MRYLTILDAVRAVAVLLVVVSHLLLQLTHGIDPAFYSFRTMGRVGVGIFFVHTTLVLMASLERHGPAAIPFYVRRAFRIYPLSIIIVLFFALMQFSARIPIDSGKLLSNLFLVQNITGHASFPWPLWSLPYEVQMYLVLPILYRIMNAARSVMWVGLLLAWSVVIAISLPSNSLALKLMLYVPCFLPGVMAFALSRHASAKLGPLFLFGLIVAVGVISIPVLSAVGVPEMPLLWGLCVVLGITIPYCGELRDGCFARGSRLIAKYSYGIYLTHLVALGAIDGLVPGPALFQWAAMLILLPGLAYICYHGIEKRGIAFGSRLAVRLGSSAKRGSLHGASSGDQPGSI